MTLLLSSVVYGVGVFHGANAYHQASPVASLEETGHREPQRSRPGTGANGLGNRSLTLRSFTPIFHLTKNAFFKLTTSEIASPSPSTTKLLDVFIEKQAQIKNLEAIVAELRKQIQTAIELGELDSLDDAGRYQYKNLTIQNVPRKSWKYSSAVETLKEREQFNGNATQNHQRLIPIHCQGHRRLSRSTTSSPSL